MIFYIYFYFQQTGAHVKCNLDLFIKWRKIAFTSFFWKKVFNVAPLLIVTCTHPSYVFDLHSSNSLFLIETVNAGFSIRQIDCLI